MASENVLEFTDANFETAFWAEWCMPCRMLAPVIDELAEDFAGQAKIGKMDTDSNRETTMQYQIQSIPTVMIFKGGELVNKVEGMANKAALTEAINAYID
jgi:thioredoxin 1